MSIYGCLIVIFMFGGLHNYQVLFRAANIMLFNCNLNVYQNS